ncbi:hypothetical protein [Thermodesulfitimonas sp.]
MGLLTLGIWGILAGALTWILTAVGWYLLARLWLRELFVPQAVFTTVFVVLLATLWAVLLGWAAFLWSLYCYHRYHRRNRRHLVPLALRAPLLPRQEFSLRPPCPSLSIPRVYPGREAAVAFFPVPSG